MDVVAGLGAEHPDRTADRVFLGHGFRRQTPVPLGLTGRQSGESLAMKSGVQKAVSPSAPPPGASRFHRREALAVSCTSVEAGSYSVGIQLGELPS